MIKPLLQEDQESFSTAWVYLDKKFLLPTRIYLLAPDGKSSKDFRLSQIKRQQPCEAKSLRGRRLRANPGRSNAIPAEPASGARQCQSAAPPARGQGRPAPDAPDQMQPR